MNTDPQHHSILDMVAGALTTGIGITVAVAAARRLLPTTFGIADKGARVAETATAAGLFWAGKHFGGGVGEGIRLAALAIGANSAAGIVGIEWASGSFADNALLIERSRQLDNNP